MKTISLLPLLLLTVTSFADDTGIRMRFGLTDKEATTWDGTVTVSPGKVALIGGWRFAQNDAVDGTTGWKARTRPAVLDRRSNNPGKAGPRAQQQQQQQPAGAAQTGVALGDNGVLLTFADVTDESQVTIKTPQGEFTFKLGDVPFGKTVDQLNNAVELTRTAAAFPLTSERSDDDFPSAARGPDGATWLTYTSFTPGVDRDERAKSWTQEPADLKFLSKPPGADQLWLRSVKGHDASPAIAITTEGRDIYKSAVAVDGSGRVWVAWAENQAYKPFPNNPAPSFDIWVRSMKDGKLSEPVKLSDSPESDVWPVAATDAKGRVWVAWQGARDKVFRIFARHQEGDQWSAPVQVSTQKRNCWAPAIAAAGDGRVAIAWDTYDKGDYDVWGARIHRRQGWRCAPGCRFAGLRGAARADLRPRWRAVGRLGTERTDLGQGLGRVCELRHSALPRPPDRPRRAQGRPLDGCTRGLPEGSARRTKGTPPE